MKTDRGAPATWRQLVRLAVDVVLASTIGMSMLLLSSASASPLTLSRGPPSLLESSAVFPGIVHDGSRIVVSYGKGRDLYVRPFDANFTPLASATKVTSAGNVTDHKHIFFQNAHYLVYSTEGDDDLYLIKLDASLAQVGATVTVVQNSTGTPTNDMLMTTDGTYIVIGIFLPRNPATRESSGHLIKRYDTSLNYVSPDFKANGQEHTNTASIMQRGSQMHIVAPSLPVSGGQVQTQTDLLLVRFDSSYATVDSAPIKLVDSRTLTHLNNGDGIWMSTGLAYDSQSDKLLVGHTFRDATSGTGSDTGKIHLRVFDGTTFSQTYTEVMVDSIQANRAHFLVLGETLYVTYDDFPAGSSRSIYGLKYALTRTPGTPACTLTASPASIAAGATSTLTANCAPQPTSYSWTGGTCAGTTAATCTVAPLATTTYTVAGVNGVGTGTSASATVTVAGATVPGAPTIGAATAGSGQATVSFTPPVSNGGSPVTSYTVTCNPGAISASGTASPIIVTGLASGTTYACSVTATNAIGTSAASGTVSVTLGNLLTVSKTGTGSGTVNSTPSGIDCGSTCVAGYSPSTSVSLTATPTSGSTFSGWGGACTGSGTCTVTMDAAKSVSATFNTAPTATTRLSNLSTRGQVQTGDNRMIGGFIIGGSAPKKVLVTARGPSLTAFGVVGAMANPSLQLVSGQTVIASNDDFGAATNASEIQATGKAPTNALESAILTTLNPGAYTAIVSGVNGGTGVGIVEVFEIDGPTIPLTNLSTRGQVQTGDNVMIGGFVIEGTEPKTVLIRANGPSLTAFGVQGALANPTLRLNSGQTTIASNDDWQSASNASAIQATGLAPANPLESAILTTLNPGAYTAIVSGANGGTGVGIVEVFAR